MLQTNYFPDQWRISTIIPIPKPNKSRTSPYNYTPIALTSTLCKTLERILNTRLLDFLSRQADFGRIQTGGLKGRSIIDQLTRLDATVRKAFVNDEHVISLFFDIEKAYNLTWKHGILRDLHDLGLRGRLPEFIVNFLTNRTFKVRMRNTLSQIKLQENGIPQGSILSVTLFTVKIDSIAKLIHQTPRFQVSLYMDDLQISQTSA